MNVRYLLSAGIVLASLLMLSTAASASVSDDQVTSQKIREADGTSGQNTNSGSGVKTGHIQNLAVTGAKIADGAVTDVKIAGPISAAKISGTVGDADTIDGMHAAEFAATAHGHAQSDVSGLSGALAAKADTGHTHDNLYQQRYANVVVVAKSGGDFTDPIAALSSISDASATNPYLIKIMPGIYDLGSATLVMKQYVDLEGSGEDTTFITSTACSSSWPPTIGTLLGANSAELRFISIENTATGLGAGIANSNSSPSLVHVTISGAFAVYNSNSSPTMTNMTVHSENCAVFNENSSPTMTDVIASATGTNNFHYAVYNLNSSPVMTDVTATTSGGSENYAVRNHNSSSPLMLRVTASATGGASANLALENAYQSSPTMRNVVVNASGASSIGMSFFDCPVSSTTTMTDVAITSDGNESRGLLLGYCNASMSNVTIVAKDGRGIEISAGNNNIQIDRSTIEGTSNSIYSTDPASVVRLGSSKLVGSIAGSGSRTCVASYDGNYVPLDSACQ